MNKKCIVLFSGGLDSRLAVKIMQEKGFYVATLFFKLPFLKVDTNLVKAFCKKNKVSLKIMDCTKGKMLKEYLEILKKAKHGRGVGFNPCIDCKIWMFKKAKKYAYKKKIKVIATGEVLGQRPMSQTTGAMKRIDESLGFKLERPLIDFGISGRSRKKQIVLAKKYKIGSFLQPAGGCLLCEKEFKKRFEFLTNNNLLDRKTLKLVRIGRHFSIKDCWFVVGRNKEENRIIEVFKKSIKSEKGKPAVYYNKKKGKKLAEELQKDYEKGGKKQYSEFKL